MEILKTRVATRCTRLPLISTLSRLQHLSNPALSYEISLVHRNCDMSRLGPSYRCSGNHVGANHKQMLRQTNRPVCQPG